MKLPLGNDNSTVIAILKNVTDFSQYELLTENNRPIKTPHVNKILRSFHEFGSSSGAITILQTKVFGHEQQFIVDGQHRTEAAKLGGYGLNLVIVKLQNDSLENITKFIAVLNNSSKSWSSQIYLDLFAKNGLSTYNKFSDILAEKNGLTITDLMFIYTGSGDMTKFKSGNLSFVNEKKSDKMLKIVLSIKDRIPTNSYARRPLYRKMFLSDSYPKLATQIKSAKEPFANDEKTFEKQLNELV